MGQWHKKTRPEPPHRHDYPRVIRAEISKRLYLGVWMTDYQKSEDVEIGDQWVCSCNDLFEVMDMKLKPDLNNHVSDHYKLIWKQITQNW